MIYYFIQVVAFQAVFLAVYELLLRKETFFNYNRAYLIVTSALSLILPFIKIESLKTTFPSEYSFQLPAVLIGEQTPRKIAAINTFTQHISETGFVWHWYYLIYIGMLFSAMVFMLKITKLFKLYRENSLTRKKNYKLITIKKSNEAFSFFNLIFLGEYIREEDRTAVLNHELIHVKQRHSYDLIWFETLRIIFWFNPFVFLYQKRIVEQHEFIADNNSIGPDNKTSYYQNLLNQLFKTNNLSFVNHFYRNSLIKKRIVMMTKNKSSKSKMFKYVLIIPIILGMLFYTSCENEQISEEQTIEDLTHKIDEVKYRLENPENLNFEEKKALEELFVQYLEHRETLKTKSEITEISQTQKLNSDEVPYGVIDEVPTIEGCDTNLPNDERKRCTSDMISKLVNQNFNTNIANEFNLIGKQRINVIFKINKDGNITSIRSRAPHPALEKEAMRVIAMLPKFTPGKQNGQSVTVPYSLPIIFQIQD